MGKSTLNSDIQQGKNSIVVIDDKDTFNKTVNVEKTVAVEKTINKANTEKLENGQDLILAEIAKITTKLNTVNKNFNKLLKLIEDKRVGE